MTSAGQITIVCTRKLDEPVIRQAEKDNITLISKDLLEITLKNPEILFPILVENNEPVIFTSQHAVNAFNNVVQKNKGISFHTDCFCIDGLTLKSVQEAGFQVLDTGKNGAELAERIILQNIQGVLHCSTSNRRDDLQYILENKGIHYRVLEVYDKKPIPEVFDSFDGVIFYSPSQVDVFLMNNMLKKNIPAFCIGHTTASHLISKGYDNVIVSPKSDTTHILQSVYSYFNK
jgi:uroporphyrinogen-III synthase